MQWCYWCYLHLILTSDLLWAAATAKNTENVKRNGVFENDSLVFSCAVVLLVPFTSDIDVMDLLTLFDSRLHRTISYLHFWRCGAEFQITQRYKSLVVAPKHSRFFFTSVPLIFEIHFQCPYNEQFTWTLKKFSKMI